MNTKVIDYIRKSTIENDHLGNNGEKKGLFISHINGFSRQHFIDETFVLKFDNDKYALYDRNSRVEKKLSEVEFFHHLDIFIEMDRLRQERIALRMTIINDEVTQYIRDRNLNKLV
jgi:hypothetical protein